MKKATNPLALDLRAGGFEVFPLAKIFDLPPNVWYPSILIRENLLAEPFAAWAANVFYTLGGVQVLQWTDAAFFYAPTANWLRPDHFVQRLTPAKVQAIISRVIRNAESANADPSRDFIIESLGIFGRRCYFSRRRRCCLYRRVAFGQQAPARGFILSF